ncbi:hypothetical protein SKPI104516_19635 [Skermania piniformis]
MQVGGQLPAGHPTQIVEADLAVVVTGQLGRRVRVQISQQAIADSLVRDCEQLFLDRLDRVTRGRSAGQRLVEIDSGQVDPHREHGGKPADRAHEVGAGDDGLFPAVSLQLQQQLRGTAAVAAPIEHRQRQSGQQTVVHPAPEQSRQGTEQGLGNVARQRDPNLVQRIHHIDLRIEGAVAEHRIGTVQSLPPEIQFGDPGRIGRLGGERVRPAANRGADGRQRRCPTGGYRRPGGHQIGDQNPPGNTVDHQVVQYHQQHAGALVAEVEPDEPQHHAVARIQLGQRGIVGLRRRCGQLVGRHRRRQLDPSHHRIRIDRPWYGYLYAPTTFIVYQARAEDVVPIENRIDRRDDAGPVDPRRQPERESLHIAGVATTALHRRPGDRQQRLPADTGAGQFGEHHRPGIGRRRRDRGQTGHRLVLEHVAGGEDDAASFCSSDELDRDDAVAAEGEERVVDPDRIDPDHLGEQFGQGRLPSVARRPGIGCSAEIRCG